MKERKTLKWKTKEPKDDRGCKNSTLSLPSQPVLTILQDTRIRSGLLTRASHALRVPSPTVRPQVPLANAFQVTLQMAKDFFCSLHHVNKPKTEKKRRRKCRALCLHFPVIHVVLFVFTSSSFFSFKKFIYL